MASCRVPMADVIRALADEIVSEVFGRVVRIGRAKSSPVPSMLSVAPVISPPGSYVIVTSGPAVPPIDCVIVVNIRALSYTYVVIP